MTRAARQLLRSFEALAEEDQREVLAKLVPSADEDFELTEEQNAELAQALAEADRGEGVDGWQFLAELATSATHFRHTP